VTATSLERRFQGSSKPRFPTSEGRERVRKERGEDDRTRGMNRKRQRNNLMYAVIYCGVVLFKHSSLFTCGKWKDKHNHKYSRLLRIAVIR
jgi:hypothetical protein